MYLNNTQSACTPSSSTIPTSFSSCSDAHHDAHPVTCKNRLNRVGLSSWSSLPKLLLSPMVLALILMISLNICSFSVPVVAVQPILPTVTTIQSSSAHHSLLAKRLTHALSDSTPTALSSLGMNQNELLADQTKIQIPLRAVWFEFTNCLYLKK